MWGAVEMGRYDRHLVLREIGPEGQGRLRSSKVLMIGAGGLGSAAGLYLAAAGVGTIGIADCDAVDLSNLQRQVIHRMDSVGKPKTASAARAIGKLNPEVEVICHDGRVTAENAQDLIESYDFILDCTDRFESKFLVNDACVLAQKPYSHAGVVRFEGQVMTYVPGQGPCLRCLLGDVPDPADAPTCAQVGVLGAMVGVMGSIQALEAVKVLLGIGEPLVGKVWCLDGLTMKTRLAALPADPDCAVCGSHPTIVSLADNVGEYEIKP